MKRNIFVLVLISILGIAPLCSAGTPSGNASIEEVKKETRDLLQTLGAYTADQKDKAVQKTKAALDKLNRHIDALEERVLANWDKLDKAARERARESLKALRKQRDQAAEWYGRLKASSGNAWENTRKGFSDAYKALSDAWEKSEKDLGFDK
jgi:cell division protein FtsB